MLLSMELCCARKKNTAKRALPIESVQCIDTIYYIYENICNNSQIMKTIQDKHFCRWHGKHLKYCQNLSTVFVSIYSHREIHGSNWAHSCMQCKFYLVLFLCISSFTYHKYVIFFVCCLTQNEIHEICFRCFHFCIACLIL